MRTSKRFRPESGYGKVAIEGEDEIIQIRIQPIEPADFASHRETLLIDTNAKREYENTIVLLVSLPEELDSQFVEAQRSEFIVGSIPERETDKDVAQFLRSERTNMGRCQEAAQKLMQKALLENGVFIFRGTPTPVSEAGKTLDAACRSVLDVAAKRFSQSTTWYPSVRIPNWLPSSLR